MDASRFQKFIFIAAILLLIWALGTFLLPLFLPFLLGGLLAFAAEPSVRRMAEKLPRGLAAAVGVTGILIFSLTLILLAAAALLRQFGSLASVLPELEQQAAAGLQRAERSLLDLADRLPGAFRTVLMRIVLNLFHSGTGLAEQVMVRLPALISGILGKLPDSALCTGTSLLSAYLISARLPRIRLFLREKLSPKPGFLPALRSLRHWLGAWLRAQVSLAAVTFAVLCAGFLILKIPGAFLRAAGVALVDAFPLLGTGVILIPWSLLQLLEGNTFRAAGLLLTFAAASGLRSLLEPKLLGKQLGIDPLLTLFALYAGWRLWGFAGMLLAPAAAAAAVNLAGNATSSQEKSR